MNSQNTQQETTAAQSSVAQLLPAFTFFRENAGYVTPPGRAACALSLARAEHSADRLGWFVTCESDEDGWRAYGDDPQPYWVAVLRVETPGWNSESRILTALGGIDVDDTQDPGYWRVLRAELAAQAIEENGWSSLADDWTALTAAR